MPNSNNRRWYVEGQGFYLVMYCREDEIQSMLDQASIPQTDIVGYHKLTLDEWKAHVLGRKAKLVSIQGRAVWVGSE